MMTPMEVVLSIMVFALFVLVAALERRAIEQEDALRLAVDATTKEFASVGQWAARVNDVLSMQSQINNCLAGNDTKDGAE